jgi:hypothetical protein
MPSLDTIDICELSGLKDFPSSISVREAEFGAAREIFVTNHRAESNQP